MGAASVASTTVEAATAAAVKTAPAATTTVEAATASAAMTTTSALREC
jgi:hypothetical protein